MASVATRTLLEDRLLPYPIISQLSARHPRAMSQQSSWFYDADNSGYGNEQSSSWQNQTYTPATSYSSVRTGHPSSNSAAAVERVPYASMSSSSTLPNMRDMTRAMGDPTFGSHTSHLSNPSLTYHEQFFTDGSLQTMPSRDDSPPDSPTPTGVSPPVKMEHEDSFVFEATSSQSHPPTISFDDNAFSSQVPLRATQASPSMKKMMGVFRLDPFAIQSGGGAISQPPTVEAGPLEEEGRYIEFQLHLEEPLLPLSPSALPLRALSPRSTSSPDHSFNYQTDSPGFMSSRSTGNGSQTHQTDGFDGAGWGFELPAEIAAVYTPSSMIAGSSSNDAGGGLGSSPGISMANSHHHSMGLASNAAFGEYHT